MNDDERYRRDKLESGCRFQDYVVERMMRVYGLAIVQYASREYQFAKGESLTGIEMKHDEKYAETGNLWIEVAEKARRTNRDYVPSGIYRPDNTWLYLIGDYRTLFVFGKRNLVLHYENGRHRYPVFENNRRTSRGFLFPDADARRLAVLIDEDPTVAMAKASPWAHPQQLSLSDSEHF